MKTDKELSCDQVIALMSIYLEEWKHRDSILWSQVFKLFYANLIIIILPNATAFLGIELPALDKNLFPIVGIFVAFVFLYVGLGYAKRLNASSKTYANVMEMLGEPKYQRVPLREVKGGKWFKLSLANVLVWTMFLALEFIALLLLVQ